MDYVIEKSDDDLGDWQIVYRGTLAECQTERERLSAADEADRTGLSEGYSSFRISIDRATMRRIDRKPRVGERVIYYGPRVFTYRDNVDIDLCEVVEPISGERIGEGGIVIKCSRFRDRIIAVFSDGDLNSNLFWVD